MKLGSRGIQLMHISAKNGGDCMDVLGISTTQKLYKGMDVWLYKYKKNGAKRATFDRLLTSYNLVRKYSLAEMQISSILTKDIQQFINKLNSDGYAYNTIKKAYNLITGFMRYLIGEGVQVNPCFINVVLPLPENTSSGSNKDVCAYNKPEQMRIISASSKLDTLGSIAAILMLETGIRSGEALALSWRDIDWDRKALNIHKTLLFPASTKRCIVQDSAKSKSSKRIIPLSQRAYNILGELYEKSIPEDESEFIFYRSTDRHASIGYNLMSSQIKALCSEAKVEYKGLHIFRHTFATNCYYKGCDIKILSKFLGHSSVTVTYNTYIHLFGDALEELRSIVN